ncbi:MAG: hypothetical protein IPK50_23835 [Fibrobacterota bacterium]|nr:hypothetical protein [Fibrobacterota bacterium]QQS05265.1 MAG: hypothetical protein IPK50_23835 [Fibrobacterota bacterium]
MRFLLLCAIIAHSASAEFVKLEAGKSAKASEVNGNFEFLAARLDSLVRALNAKDTVIQRLSSSRWSDTVAALRAEVVRLDTTRQIPKGTIAAFLSEPESDGYLPGSGKSWLLAAGQPEVNGTRIPDLRGLFLRGADYVVTGRAATGYDPDGIRKAGSGQADAFQGHWHQMMWQNKIGGWGVDGTGFYDYNGASLTSKGRNNVRDAITDSANGNPRTASESRPKNVAVYWYVKVK